ncbi:MAG: hypothetical protein NZ878_13605 [SAR324 cluster bacterium]|nr:hypothetical protein [SAR324 cluster bacterium]
MSNCEEFVGVTERGIKMVELKSSASTERYSHLSGEETLETGAAISKKLYG